MSRGLEAAGTVSLNKPISVGMLESRSVSAANTVFQPAFTASLRVYSSNCVACSVGLLSYPHSTRSFYILLTFTPQLVLFRWITPAHPVENLQVL